MKLTVRNVHRDLAYFYLGLIIAFSVSGILLNHRETWFPRDYTYNAVPVEVQLPDNPKDIDEAYIATLSNRWGIADQYKGFRTRGNTLRITYQEYLVEIDLETGQGEKESYIKVPVIAQFTQLHMDTSGAWIWYSDVFGIALLTIAITGMFVQKGKSSFRQRGWKLALAGVLFPLAFLFLIS